MKKYHDKFNYIVHEFQFDMRTGSQNYYHMVMWLTSIQCFSL